MSAQIPALERSLKAEELALLTRLRNAVKGGAPAPQGRWVSLAPIPEPKIAYCQKGWAAPDGPTKPCGAATDKGVAPSASVVVALCIRAMSAGP